MLHRDFIITGPPLVGAALAAVVLGAAGCADSAALGEDGLQGNGGNGLGDAAYFDTMGAERVEFDDESIFLLPNGNATLPLRVSPPGSYTVRFALVGDSQDAFLDRNFSLTEPDGRSAVRVTHASSFTSYSVRASVGGSVSDVVLVLANEGVTNLRVAWKYNGTRSTDSWFAMVSLGPPCAQRMGIPPMETGGLSGESADGTPPVVEGVPIGRPLTVTLRARHYAGGCLDVSALTASAENRVEVTVSDRPLQMSEAEFDLHLGLPEGDAWKSAFGSTFDLVTNALIADASNDAEALLDAMEANAPTATISTEFSLARKSAQWETIVAAPWAGDASSAIRRTARDWLSAGLDRLAGDGAFSGKLIADPAQPERATWALTAVAGLDPETAGFPATQAVTWKAEANDRVSVGAEGLMWRPSRLAAALADSAAAEDDFAGVAEALARTAGCEGIAERLLETSELLRATSCEETCLETMCRSALETMWERARTASPESTRMELVVTGRAVIDGEARPVGIEGEWVAGAVFDGGGELRLDGPATHEPPEPNR